VINVASTGFEKRPIHKRATENHMSRQGEIKLTWTNDEGDEVEHTFPSVNEVCEHCEGYGTYLNPSIGQHAYSMEEFQESFDEEDQAEYFKRGGIYDVQCEVCQGNKVMPVVAENLLKTEEKALYQSYQDSQERSARYEAEDRHTRFMESGGYDY
jgi:hypothetical protein